MAADAMSVDSEFEKANLNDLKVLLVNFVCASLIKEPKFKDPKTALLLKLFNEVAARDPEFLLKLALYIRDDLNIRSTANLLVALASNCEACTPFLKKYINNIIRLPSDWLDIAAIYNLLPDRKLQGKALPTALRKALILKFPDFDSYQLAKYNREGKLKRKAKKEKKKTKQKQPNKTEEQTATPPERKPLTMKQMIRQLHICQPVGPVMAILGKKYPLTEEEFRKTGLSGQFEPERAGKRMKLPVPETWETLLSAQGNKAATWEQLIDHRKLPFMAMLRNLRNMILCGISEKHHRWVLSRLKDEKTIANCRQFPFRFFSAYEAINLDLQKLQQDISEAQAKAKNPAKKQKKAKKTGKTPGVKKVIIPVNMPTEALLTRYREALDTAVKYATAHNVKPIRGSTVAFCCVRDTMNQDCRGAKGMGAIHELTEVGVLLGLMCKYMSEECDFRIFSAPKSPKKPGHIAVDLQEGTILNNMARVKMLIPELETSICEFPFDYVEELIRERKKIDQFLIIGDMPFDSPEIRSIIGTYRQEINPDILFVNINLQGNPDIALPSPNKHPNDVSITGFSDAILRYIAERGDSNQLQYIQHIDKVKDIKEKIKKETKKQTDFFSTSSNKPKISVSWKSVKAQEEKTQEGPSLEEAVINLQKEQNEALEKKLSSARSGKWRTAKIFVSSTFLDMHGERNFLTKVIFPELRERCRKRKINLFEIDLRWGITREEAEHGTSLEVCLSEVDKCRPFFIGLLGHRYGWVPSSYTVPDESRFDWLKRYPKGRSVTELEMVYGALLNPKATKAFFYVRSNEFLKQIPQQYRGVFLPENPEAEKRIRELRAKVSQSQCTHKTYSCEWGGVAENTPITKGLEEFGAAVLEDLWKAICEVFPEDVRPASTLETEREYHEHFIEKHGSRFIGRQQAVKQLTQFADGRTPGTLIVHGKPGVGKSALLAHFCRTYALKHPNIFVLGHFIGASPGSTDIRHTLSRICREIADRYGLTEEIPEDYKELRQTFFNFLEQTTGKPMILIIDSLNQLSQANNGQALDWLPTVAPIKIIASTYTDTPVMEALNLRKPNILELEVTLLEVKDKQELVRKTLAEYRKKLEENPSNNQLRSLTSKTDSGKPLFLVLACEELRVFGVFEQVSEKIKKLPGTIPFLLNDIMNRLEQEHGKELVKSSLSLLACSRSGLLENELLILLARKGEEQLPRALWSRLFRSLEQFLTNYGESSEALINIFHSEMIASIKKRYLSRDASIPYHARLAKYFISIADPLHDHSWSGSKRAIAELPYHLTQAKMNKEVHSVLCDIGFLERKCKLEMTYDLLTDFNDALEMEWSDASEGLAIHQFYRFISSNAYIFIKHPELMLQQAANQPDTSFPSQIAFQNWESSSLQPIWLQWLNKPQEQDPCIMTLSGYAEPMLACAYSPDGKVMACASRDRTIKIWDAITGNEISTLVGHSNSVVACTFSPNGRQIASGSWDCTIKIWDARHGNELRTLVGHAKRVSAVCYSHNGEFLLSASWDCSLILWNTASGEKVRHFSGHTKPVNACAFSPDDSQIVSASWDCTIKVWSIEGKQLLTLSGHSNSVRSVLFSPTGKQIVSTSVDCSIKVWDLRTGEALTTLNGHSQPVNTISFSSDGKRLVSASDDSTIKVWDAVGGNEIMTINSRDSTALTCCGFSPDNKKVAAGSSDCSFSVWDILSSNIDFTCVGHTRVINSVCYSPTEDKIASCSDDNTLKIWDALTGTELQTLTDHVGAVTCCAYSPNGKWLVSTSEDHTAILWSCRREVRKQTILKGHDNSLNTCCFNQESTLLATGGRDYCIILWSIPNATKLKTLVGHKDWVTGCSFSSDGKHLASASWDFTVRIWEVNGSATSDLCVLEGHSGSVSSCAFAPDNRRVISASSDTTLKIWDSIDKVAITTLEGHNSRVNCIAFSKSGAMVSCSDDGTLKIWDVQGGKEVTTLQGHSGNVKAVTISPVTGQVLSTAEDCTVRVWDGSSAKPSTHHKGAVNTCAFSPDGQYLATGARDASLSIWKMDVNKCLKLVSAFEGHTKSVNCCVFSPNGALVASASDDKTVILWEVSSGRKQRIFKGHTNAVTSCAFSSDGKNILSASWDKTIIEWDMDGNQVRVARGHSDWINDCNYSPTRKWVASASHDHTVRVWSPSPSSFTQVMKLEGHSNWVLSCSFSENEQQLVTTSYDHCIKIFSLRDGSSISIDNIHTKRINKALFTKDNKFLISISHDGTLKVLNAQDNFSSSSIFYCKGLPNALAISPKGNAVACGDSLGNVYWLKIMQIDAMQQEVLVVNKKLSTTNL